MAVARTVNIPAKLHTCSEQTIKLKEYNEVNNDNNLIILYSNR